MNTYVEKIKASMLKIWEHIKHRASRLKTYMGTYILAMMAAQQYWINTPISDMINYSLMLCSVFIVFSGGKLPQLNQIENNKE